jgi:hypothetical protein
LPAGIIAESPSPSSVCSNGAYSVLVIPPGRTAASKPGKDKPVRRTDGQLAENP